MLFNLMQSPNTAKLPTMLNFSADNKKEPQRDPLLSLQEAEPQKPSLSWLGIFLDSVLVLVSLAFVVFASLALASDGQPLLPGSRAQYLLTATFYGPTIFPIVFAAIVGRSLKALATWELQKGSTIGRIETLSGSSTLIGAVITQIQLRNLNILAVALLLLWALSPVGGQASLRIARSGTRIVKTQHQITFLDPSSLFNLDGERLINTLFGASLVTTKLLHGKPQDSWGNLRIPMVEAFDDYQNHEWIEIPADTTDTTFSSLVGIPFSPTLPDEKTSFTLNTSYISLDCPVFELRAKKKDTTDIFTNFTSNAPPLEHPNNTWSVSVTAATHDRSIIPLNGFQIAMSNCLWGCSSFLSTKQVEEPREARRLIWESASEDNVSYIDCTLHSTYVDVNYTCLNTTCAPDAVRLSPTTPSSGYFSHPLFPDANPRDPWNARNFTGFDRSNGNADSEFLSSITGAFTIASGHERMPVLGFLLSPNTSFAIPPQRIYYDDVTTLGRALFETRLAQLFNTLFILGIEPNTIIGALPVSVENGRNDSFNVATRTAETEKAQTILICNKAWFGTMMFICSVILLVSVSGAVLRALTLVPDVLGTLSMVTLDNRCEKPLQKASMLDGLERSRLLKGVSIKLGNVELDSRAGRIAFAAPADSSEIIELHESGLYS